MKESSFTQCLQMSFVGATGVLTKSLAYPLNLQRIQDLVCRVFSTFLILPSTSFMKQVMQSGSFSFLVSAKQNWNSSPVNGHLAHFMVSSRTPSGRHRLIGRELPRLRCREVFRCTPSWIDLRVVVLLVVVERWSVWGM